MLIDHVGENTLFIQFSVSLKEDIEDIGQSCLNKIMFRSDLISKRNDSSSDTRSQTKFLNCGASYVKLFARADAEAYLMTNRRAPTIQIIS